MNIFIGFSTGKFQKFIFITIVILILSFSSSCNLPVASLTPSAFPEADVVLTPTRHQITITLTADEAAFQQDPSPEDSRSPESNAPSQSPEKVCEYEKAFGIDYCHPEAYLAQGSQSVISDPSVLANLRAETAGVSQLEAIYQWLHRTFEAYSAGGKTIGVVTVDQLLQERRLGGCHDFALVYAAVARELGYPAVMMRTDSLAWIKRFQEGDGQMHVGHVFVEVFLEGSWLLIDSTNGWFVEEGYDPADPVIPLKGNFGNINDEIYGLYVECKGVDIWDFGIYSQAESTQAMDDLAQQLNLDTISYPEYVFQQFTR